MIPLQRGSSELLPQRVDKVGFCHSEPVTDVTGVGIRILKALKTQLFEIERIATPV